MNETQITVTYSAEIKGQLEEAIGNCLYMFNAMSRHWIADRNIEAAKASIMAEITHLLELPELEAPEGDGN